MVEEELTKSEQAYNEALAAIAEAVVPVVRRHGDMRVSMEVVVEVAGLTGVEQIRIQPKDGDEVSVIFGPDWIPAALNEVRRPASRAPMGSPPLNRAERRRRDRGR